MSDDICRCLIPNRFAVNPMRCGRCGALIDDSPSPDEPGERDDTYDDVSEDDA